MGWTRETVSELAYLADRRAEQTEFDRKRHERMQEREARARLYRPSGNVIQFPRRSPVNPPPRDAA